MHTNHKFLGLLIVNDRETDSNFYCRCRVKLSALVAPLKCAAFGSFRQLWMDSLSKSTWKQQVRYKFERSTNLKLSSAAIHCARRLSWMRQSCGKSAFKSRGKREIWSTAFELSSRSSFYMFARLFIWPTAISCVIKMQILPLGGKSKKLC